MVSVLDFYSDDPSSNLAEEMKKRPLLAHLKEVSKGDIDIRYTRERERGCKCGL